MYTCVTPVVVVYVANGGGRGEEEGWCLGKSNSNSANSMLCALEEQYYMVRKQGLICLLILVSSLYSLSVCTSATCEAHGLSIIKLSSVVSTLMKLIIQRIAGRTWEQVALTVVLCHKGVSKVPNCRKEEATTSAEEHDRKRFSEEKTLEWKLTR